jgi:hypothetical protein
MKAIQNAVPLGKLAAPGRVQKTAGVREKENEVERHLHGRANRPLPPRYRRAEPGGHGQKPKEHREPRSVVAIVASSQHKQL